ncbi:MAG: MFS transporter [Anaerolineaceae bacterium]|nr:MFS transporter [Anaerolineaceae bacterium]
MANCCTSNFLSPAFSTMVETAPSAALAGDFADPAKRGTAMGGFNLFGSLGFAVGPFVGGLIADSYGFHVSFAAAGLAVFLVALIFLPLLISVSRNK